MEIKKVRAAQRVFFATGETRSLKFRKAALGKLRDALIAYEPKILAALYEDLHKPAFEAFGTEIGIVMSEIDSTLANLERWMRPEAVGSPLFAFPSSSYIQREPYGLTLIIAPWNYPFQLLMAPLVGALAAGNCVMLKPSELAPATSAVAVELIRSTFDEEFVAIAEGGVETSQALLAERWDYIFFTGGTEVGRIVYKAAAQYLTPVTLELGGKSPCIVDADTNVDLAAKRIVWGKYVNAGQTCIAPDYILVDAPVKDKLVAALAANIKAFYGENPQKSDDYCRIINQRHFERLVSYLSDVSVAVGGEHDAESKYIAPTVVTDVKPDSKIMQDEIFGPILPVIAVDGIDEAIDFINERPKPLALYVFSRSDRQVRRVLSQTSSGGVCVNDTLMHIANSELPFGGVGESGIGAYHGKSSFEVFSHAKAVLDRSTLIDPPVRYPPYKIGLNALKKLLKWTL